MTKLRRLDPQPADLTTHKGPFLCIAGLGEIPATLVYPNFKGTLGDDSLVFILHISNDTDQVFVAKRDTKNFFAAEEIREPIVWFAVFRDNGRWSGHVFVRAEDAKTYADELGGTVKKFDEDASYGGGV